MEQDRLLETILF